MVFAPLADASIVVDMIVQTHVEDGRTDLTFTVPAGDLPRATRLLVKQCAGRLSPAEQIKTDDEPAKVSVVGVGMRSHAGVAQKMFELLAKENINIQLISTSARSRSPA